jgi:Domain of unknown function (DUF4390)
MRRRLLLAGLFVALSAALPEGPEARCAASYVNSRVLVDLTANGLVGRELERLIKLGLPGTLEVDTRVLRRHPLWFDTEVATSHHELKLSFDPASERWQLGSRAQQGPDHLEFPRLIAGSDLEPGLYRVEVHLAVRVVTTESLASTVKWVGQAAQTKVPNVVLEAVAQSLVHTAEAQCAANSLPVRER